MQNHHRTVEKASNNDNDDDDDNDDNNNIDHDNVDNDDEIRMLVHALQVSADPRKLVAQRPTCEYTPVVITGQ